MSRTNYRYDENGLLKDEIRISSPDYATRTSYFWEKGKGNVGTFRGVQYHRFIGLPLLKSQGINKKMDYVHPQLMNL